MPTQTEESAIVVKTRELCQAILDEPEVRALRQKIDTFMANDQARGQYDALVTKGQTLQEKQHSGINLSEAEIAEFEKLREAFINSPLSRDFLDAQEGMQKMQKTVSSYVSKTFELGRVPEESDMDSGGCGHGCGCHH